MIDRLFYIGAALTTAWTTTAQARSAVQNYKIECNSEPVCHVTGSIEFIVRNTINGPVIIPTQFIATKYSTPLRKGKIAVASMQVYLIGSNERYTMGWDGKIAKNSYKAGSNSNYISLYLLIDKLKKHKNAKIYISYIADVDVIGHDVVNMETEPFVKAIEKVFKRLNIRTKRAER